MVEAQPGSPSPPTTPSERTKRLRVLVADDHRLFRDGLRALLSTAGDAELVGEAETGDEAIALADQLVPDVVLMDIQMPGTNGIAATRRIVSAHPHVGVLVVTMFEDDQSVFAAMRAGARGYVVKGAGYEELLRALRAVAAGDAIFSPTIAERMMGYFATLHAPRAADFPQLSDREREVLTLIARGHKNAEIASRLVITPKTVRNHVSNILDKIQAADRAEAMRRAREAGLT